MPSKYDARVSLDGCFDDTILEDVIQMLSDIKDGKYKGAKAISVLIPKHFVVCGDTQSEDCSITIELGNL